LDGNISAYSTGNFHLNLNRYLHIVESPLYKIQDNQLFGEPVVHFEAYYSFREMRRNSSLKKRETTE